MAVIERYWVTVEELVRNFSDIYRSSACVVTSDRTQPSSALRGAERASEEIEDHGTLVTRQLIRHRIQRTIQTHQLLREAVCLVGVCT